MAQRQAKSRSESEPETPELCRSPVPEASKMKARCISEKNGSGSLSITGGATVSSSLFALGQSTGSSGTATVSGSGSTWTNLVFCFVGQDGDGTLNITDGGSVSDSDAVVGGSSIGVVIVDGAGSSWVQPGTLTIGGNAGATGTLTISNGGNVFTGGSGGTFGSTIAYNTGSSGTVNVSGVGSTWMNKGPLAVSGVGGDGILHITSGGAVSNGNCILGVFERKRQCDSRGSGFNLDDQRRSFRRRVFLEALER